MADGAAGGIELESLVTRLIGDASSFMESMNQTVNSINKVVGNVKQQSSEIENFQKRIDSFASGITSALGAIGLGTGLKSMVSTFQGAENAQFRLSAAMEANGAVIGSNLKVYQNFASEMSRTTLASGTEVTQLLATAESMGVTGDAAMRAAKNAITLSASFEGSADSFIRQTAGLEQGSTMMLGRYIPALQGIQNESEKATYAQDFLAGRFKIAQAATQTSAGSFNQLQKALGGLRKDFGAVISQALMPVVEWLTQAVQSFRQLDPSIKRVIAGAIAMTAAISGWGPIVKIISGVVGPTMKLAMTILTFVNPFTLIGAGIIAAIAAITIFIQKSGGVSEAFNYVKDIGVAAWEWIKSSAMSFWDWFQPIWKAMGSLASAAWDKISAGAVWLWNQAVIIFGNIKDFVAGVWEAITGGATVNWQMVQDVIMNALLFAEYTLNHFGDVASLVWTTISYGFVSFINQVQFFFTDEVPAYINWFSKNWREIFTDIFNFTKTVFQNLGENIVNIISNLPDLISGKTNFGDLWKPLTEGFQRQSEKLVLPERVMGPLERELKERMEKEGADVAMGFAEFRDKKLKEFGAPDIMPGVDKAGEEAAKFGKGVEKNIKDSKKELDKFEHALFGTADAFARIQDYLDKIARKDKDTMKKTAETVAAAAVAPPPMLHAVVAEAKAARVAMGDLAPFAAPGGGGAGAGGAAAGAGAMGGGLWGIQRGGAPAIPMGDLAPFNAAGAAMGGGIAEAIRRGGIARPGEPIPVEVAPGRGAAAAAAAMGGGAGREISLLQQIRDLLAAQAGRVMDVEFANLA